MESPRLFLVTLDLTVTARSAKEAVTMADAIIRDREARFGYTVKEAGHWNESEHFSADAMSAASETLHREGHDRLTTNS